MIGSPSWPLPTQVRHVSINLGRESALSLRHPQFSPSLFAIGGLRSWKSSSHSSPAAAMRLRVIAQETDRSQSHIKRLARAHVFASFNGAPALSRPSPRIPTSSSLDQETVVQVHSRMDNIESRIELLIEEVGWGLDTDYSSLFAMITGSPVATSGPCPQATPHRRRRPSCR